MKVQAIYASTSGNVEVVVEKIAATLNEAGISVELNRAEKTAPTIFNTSPFFVLATSTWEHGVLNPFFQRLHTKMKQMNFAGKKAAFVGLGDTRYEPVLFARGMHILKETWVAQGGEAVYRPLTINGEPYHVLPSVVREWSEGLASEVKTYLENAHHE